MPTEKEKPTQNTQELEQETQPNDLMISMPPKMQRFIHLYMTGQYTSAKLASLLDVHPNTVMKWLKRPDVKEVIADMTMQTHDMVNLQLKILTNKAVNKLHNLIDSPIDGVALQAVKDVLDRAGHKSKQEIKIDKTVTTVEQQMKELIDATIVEADFTEIVDGE